jgi:hypothetical protein
VKLARSVRDPVRQRLIACTAGRCEFRGCNKDLFQHPLTGAIGNYAEAAHIVAFQIGGPRGATERPANINAFENLMLLCQTCHKLVDDHPNDYPSELLREHKREHEERIHALTALGPEYRTTVIQLRATIGGQPVDIPGTDIRTALQPRYPARLPGVLIDLTALRRENPSFFELARDQIRRELRPALRAELEHKHVQHYSVLALAPIPILACLGREIGSKVTTDLFQRHRDHSWGWREDGDVVEYHFRTIRDGSDPTCVGLQLALSGRIAATSLPAAVDDRFTLYEITLVGLEPGVEYLHRREDLSAFRRIYRNGLARIAERHQQLRELHLFPAVPAPVAIACGQEVMPKAHPALVVYDHVKGSFVHAITINTKEDHEA